MSIRKLVALATLVVFIGCSSDSDNLEVEEIVTFISLDREFNTLQIESPKRLTAVYNQFDLQQVWPSISSQSIPTIEPRSSTIVVAEMGTRGGTGVAEIVVEKIESKTKHVEVTVTSYVPGLGCGEDDAISTPFHAVQFNGVLPVLFRENMVIVQCE